MPSKAKRLCLSVGPGATSGPLEYVNHHFDAETCVNARLLQLQRRRHRDSRRGQQVSHTQKLICRTSEFFQNAAKPEWTREAQPLVLEEETAHIFGLYTIWLYNGTTDRAKSDLKTWKPLSQAYVMGERFMDPHFQAVILEAMAHRADAGKQPNIMTINDIYCGTTLMKLLSSYEKPVATENNVGACAHTAA
jgi:hypothetical protein